jgi:choline dehydrogenase
MAVKLILNALFVLVSAVGAAPAAGKYARVVQPKTVSNTTYDFIIVGGGIGGLTVADRLTEDPNGITYLPSNNTVADNIYSDCFGCRVRTI